MKTIRIVDLDGKEMRLSFHSDKEFAETFCNLLHTYCDCLECDFSCFIDEFGCMVIKLIE